MSDKVKQVIVARKDLNMPAGKLAAQVAHASMSFLTRGLERPWSTYTGQDPWSVGSWLSSDGFNSPMFPEKRLFTVDEELSYWIDGSFTKIVVSVPDEATLLAVYNAAKRNGCRSSLIRDEGRTVFGGVPTYTCVAVGPNYIEKVDAVTKALPLYR